MFPQSQLTTKQFLNLPLSQRLADLGLQRRILPHSLQPSSTKLSLCGGDVTVAPWGTVYRGILQVVASDENPWGADFETTGQLS